MFEARAIPNSHKLVFTAAAHHSNMGGSLVLLDRTRGTEYERPLVRLTPEVCFPETEGWPRHYYADPFPLAVQTMRSLTYVQPNTTLSCIGCHEPRGQAPPVSSPPLAALREPSRLSPGPEGSWPLRFDQLVGPVLDKHCVRCHRPDSDDAKAAKFDLTPAKAYDSLLGYADRDLEKLAFEKSQSAVGQMPARKSKLMALLTTEGGHEGVRLDADSRDRLVTWMDLYAHRQGHFSDQQEEQLRQLRQAWAKMIATGPEGKPSAP